MFHFLVIGFLSFHGGVSHQHPPIPDTLRIYVDSPNVIRFIGKPTLISAYNTDSTIDLRLSAYLKGSYRLSHTLPKYLQIIYQTRREKALFKEGVEAAVETALLDVLGYLQGRHIENVVTKFPIVAQRSFN